MVLHTDAPSSDPCIDTALSFELDVSAALAALASNGRLVTVSAIPAQCTLTGDGANHAIVARPSCAKLTLRDTSARPVTSVVRATALPLISANWLQGQYGQEVDEDAMRISGLALTVAGGAGEVDLSYTWPSRTVSCTRRLHIALCGQAIAGSPFSIQIIPEVAADACELSGHGANQAMVTRATLATLTLRDTTHRPVAAAVRAAAMPLLRAFWLRGLDGHEEDNAATQSSGLALSADDATLGPESIALTYTWPAGTAVGQRRLGVTLSGQHILGSPFKVNVDSDLSSVHCTLSGNGASQAVTTRAAAALLTLRYATNRPVTAAVREAAMPLLRACWLRGPNGNVEDEATTRNSGLTLSTWVPDDAFDSCMQCQEPFDLFRRKHHCRFCGRLLCDECTKERLPRRGRSVSPPPSLSVAAVLQKDNQDLDHRERSCRACSDNSASAGNGAVVALSYSLPANTAAGPRRLSVTLGGRPISGSPFSVLVSLSPSLGFPVLYLVLFCSFSRNEFSC
jgi:hypothetical protein